MKISFFHKLGMGYPTTCVYQFICDDKDKNDTHITKYFVMHGFGLCIKVDSYVDHMFYSWSFSHNTVIPTAIKKNKYFLSLNKNTTIFSWGAGNSNKNGMQRVYKLL